MESAPKIVLDNNSPLVTQVAQYLRSYIGANLQTGDKLPSERMLCKMFGVSRITVGKAIASLVQEGVVYQLHGSGTYVADPAAADSSTIAVAVYHSDNAFYSKVVKAIQEEAAQAGFHTLLINTKGEREAENIALRKLRGKVSGIILAPAMNADDEISSELAALIGGNFPVVVICHSGRFPLPVNTVIPNYHLGGYLATSHLIERGYRRILFGATGNIFYRQDIQLRFSGYLQALKDHRLAFHEEWLVMGDGQDVFNGFFQDGLQVAERVAALLEPDTALFSLGDSFAIGLLRGLREKGIAVPEQCGLCGFDDIELAGQWGIELTTVKVLCEDIARESVRIVAEQIRRQHRLIENVITPVELVPRRTTLGKGPRQRIGFPTGNKTGMVPPNQSFSNQN